VQLLAARDATVVATGTAPDADRLTGLGATTVIDYTTGDVAEQVLTTYPDGVDALIELVTYTPDASPLAAVRKGGKASSTTNAADEQTLATAGLTGTNSIGSPVREATAPLAEKAAAGALKIDVNTVLPLEQATDGLATIAGGKARGKIVVKISD
jgi:NADPH:quinone reductase-like Zn-dependent oxidoreductase